MQPESLRPARCARRRKGRGEVARALQPEVLRQLLHAACADDDAGDSALLQYPAEGVGGQRLAACGGFVVERSEARLELGREHLVGQRGVAGHTAVGRYAVEIAVGEQALRQRREGDEANALLAAVVEDAFVAGRLIDEVEPPLVDEQRCVVGAEVTDRGLEGREGPATDADVERLALTHDVHEGLQRLLEGRERVVAVAVEEVDVVEVHAPQALLQARHEILAAAPVAVGAGPHVVAGLGGDEQFVAVRAEVVVHQAAHRLLGGAVWRAVVVGEVEVGDAVVEGVVGDGAAALVGRGGAKVLPETEAHLRQQYAAMAAAAVEVGVVVAMGGGYVILFQIHDFLFCTTADVLYDGRRQAADGRRDAGVAVADA